MDRTGLSVTTPDALNLRGFSDPPGFTVVPRPNANPARFDLQRDDGSTIELPDYGTVAEARAAAWALADKAASMTQTEAWARETLAELGVLDPSIGLLRAQLMRDHAANARDLAVMQGLPADGFDAAEEAAADYRNTLLRLERGETN